MYLPHRHRRKLFFPPGLLALAFLLLMGCMQIGKYPNLRPKAVMPLNLFPVYPHTEFAEYENTPFYLSKRQLERFCNWDELTLTGYWPHDSLTLVTANRTVADYQKYAMHRRGLRVRFSDKARYASLIGILNIMHIHNMKKYWFDLHHTPVTFYVYVEKSSSFSTHRNFDD